MAVSSVGTTSNLQQGLSLLQTSSQTSTSIGDMADYPTNLQQAVQDQVTLSSNSSIAQDLSSQVLTPLQESQSEAVQVLSAESQSTSSDSSLTSLETSMQTMQDLTNAGAVENNSALTEALIQNYSTVLADPTTLGSLLDTSA